MAPKKASASASADQSVELADGSRSFRLRADGDVTSVAFGADPHVSIAADETYVTSDPRLAAQLAADPHFEEVSSQCL
jgi:hypothetical protein